MDWEGEERAPSYPRSGACQDNFRPIKQLMGHYHYPIPMAISRPNLGGKHDILNQIR